MDETKKAKLRSRAVIEAKLKQMKEQQATHGRFYPLSYDGIIPALEWVLSLEDDIPINH